jgi:hypothetical protein
VLNQDTLDEVGPAINSGRSMFLHGESGNGKTSIAEIIAACWAGPSGFRMRIEIDGQIIVIYDPLYHRSPHDATKPRGGWGRSLAAGHRSRPALGEGGPAGVLTGGELSLNQLDLEYDTFTKLYQAPFQVKSNGGVLIIDDFWPPAGPAADLLNRWIVPLEKRIDFPHSAHRAKFPIPFDVLLSDRDEHRPEAARRGGVPPPDPLQDPGGRARRWSSTSESSGATARTRQIAYDPNAVRQVYKNFYHAHSIAPRGCHPRDILDHLVDIAKYLEIPPTLSQDLVERAGRSYFLDFPTAP